MDHDGIAPQLDGRHIQGYDYCDPPSLSRQEEEQEEEEEQQQQQE